ncbi:MAG: hypothetical protein CRU78_19910, partial [Candidatus Accumulibacter phosphatis]|nr:hypothetical protein [Candidatus Accumulibacter phosphatis]
MISEGVAKANRKLNNLRYEPWEFNDTAGNLLISPVVDAIDQSCFIVADITYLNPNVVYEIGFSIGRSRRCFLVRHTGTDGDKKIARDVGIFDTLGFEPYETADELTNTLTAYVDPAPLPFSAQLDRRAPVYVVEPPTKGGIATVMTSRLKKARYKYRSFNP